MHSARTVALLSLLGISSLRAEDTRLYTAQTVDPLAKEGAIVAGKSTWQCHTQRCTTRAAWKDPAIEACQALARTVGVLRSWGREGAMLTSDELRKCNAVATARADIPLGSRPAIEARMGRVWKPVVTSVVPEHGKAIFTNSRIIILGKGLMPRHLVASQVTSGTTTSQRVELMALTLQQRTENAALFAGTFGGKTVDKEYRLVIPNQIGSEIASWTDTEIRARLYGGVERSGRYQLSITETYPESHVAGRTTPFHLERADGDGDGHDSIAAGGDDCDDEDPNRYPGHTEVCDREGRDEDCNTGTFGNKDEDRDGYVDAGCFNWSGGRSGKRFGGEDCDDGRRSVHPGNVEACNGIDDDCDGEVDEGLIGCRRP